MKTPIQKLNSFSRENQIYIKREDLLPLSFGGNKVRLAYCFVKDMKKKNADCIIGYGSSFSNLIRALSNVCCSENIPCYIVVSDDNNGKKTSNFLLTELSEAKIITTDKSKVKETLDSLFLQLRSKGLTPYYIYGNSAGKGNYDVPAEAYFNVYKEILEQEQELKTVFDYVFLASGTGMTQSGLLCGKGVFGGPEIIGISVARESDIGKRKIQLYAEEFIKNKTCFLDKHSIVQTIRSNLIFLDDYIEGGYGKINHQIYKVVKDLYKNEGISADCIYVGKAFWGMMRYLKKEKITEKNVLFIHTGGTPIFFDSLNEKGLYE